MVAVARPVHAHRPQRAGGEVGAVRPQHQLLGLDLGAAVGVARQPRRIGQRLVAVDDRTASLDHHVDGARVDQPAYAEIAADVDDEPVALDVDLLRRPRRRSSVSHTAAAVWKTTSSAPGRAQARSTSARQRMSPCTKLADLLGRRLQIEHAHLPACRDRLADDLEAQHARAADDQAAPERLPRAGLARRRLPRRRRPRGRSRPLMPHLPWRRASRAAR